MKIMFTIALLIVAPMTALNTPTLISKKGPLRRLLQTAGGDLSFNQLAECRQQFYVSWRDEENQRFQAWSAERNAYAVANGNWGKYQSFDYKTYEQPSTSELREMCQVYVKDKQDELKKLEKQKNESEATPVVQPSNGQGSNTSVVSPNSGEATPVVTPVVTPNTQASTSEDSPAFSSDNRAPWVIAEEQRRAAEAKRIAAERKATAAQNAAITQQNMDNMAAHQAAMQRQAEQRATAQGTNNAQQRPSPVSCISNFQK